MDSSHNTNDRCALAAFLKAEVKDDFPGIRRIPATAARHLVDFVDSLKGDRSGFLEALALNLRDKTHSATSALVLEYQRDKLEASSRYWKYRPLRLRKMTAQAFARRDFDLKRLAGDLQKSVSEIESELEHEQVKMEDLKRALLQPPAGQKELRQAFKRKLKELGYALVDNIESYTIEVDLIDGVSEIEVFFPSAGTQLAFKTFSKTGAKNLSGAISMYERLGLNEWDLIDGAQTKEAILLFTTLLGK